MVKKLMALMMSLPMMLVVSRCEVFPKKTHRTDIVTVYINEEYKNEFSEKKFTVEDFEWKNAEKIVYNDWRENYTPESGTITVYLHKHGEKQVSAAIEHFNTLEFVYRAELVNIAYPD